MALCFRKDIGGRYDAQTEWFGVEWNTSIDLMYARGGSIIDYFASPPTVHIIKKKMPDLAWLRVGNLILVIGRLKSIIENKSQDKIEFIPVKTFLMTNKKAEAHLWPEDDSFYIMNPLDVVDCVDEDRSEYVREVLFENEKQYDKIQFLYLLNDRIRGRSVFRVSGVRYLIFMSEELVKDLKVAGSLGARWCPTDEIFAPPEVMPDLCRDRPRSQGRKES